MLEVKEGVGEEIREVDPFLWTSDQTTSEQVSAVSTGMEQLAELSCLMVREGVTVQRLLQSTRRKRDFSPQVSAGWDDNGNVFFDFDNKLLQSITAERRSSEYCLTKIKAQYNNLLSLLVEPRTK